MNYKKYSLFIGRFQIPEPHAGHIALVETVLNEGKNALIAIRSVPIDKNNPYSASAISVKLGRAFEKWGDKVKIMIIDDIEEVVVGRNVGYRVIKLSEELESISATNIRNKK